MTHMEIKEILQYLPHRYPFLLIDRVLELELEPAKRIVTVRSGPAMNAPMCNRDPILTGAPAITMMPRAAANSAIGVMRESSSENAS